MRTAITFEVPETEAETRLKLHTNLGTVLFSQGRLQEASQEYGAALQIEPRAYLVWHNMGLVYENLGNQARARDAYRRALEIQPLYNDSREGLRRLGGG